MRVAFISAVFPPTQGGMCTVAGAEARAMSRSGTHQIEIFTLQTDDSRQNLVIDRSCDAPVIRLRGFPRISLSGFVPQLLWKLRTCDVVYAHLPAYGFMEVLILWKIFTRRRLVVTLHMDPVGTGFFKYIFKIERIVLRALLRVADRIRVSTQNFSREKIFKNIKREKISIIPFGIDLKRFYPAAKPTNKNIFLFVGRLSRTHYFKGVELLLRAFHVIVQKNFDAELWIVGDGDERAQYERITEKLHISKKVRFFGAVSDDALPEIYRQARVMVLPSTDSSETFGLVLLEAMASGVPVIASDVPGVDQLVVRDVVGKLIDPGNEQELVDALVDACTFPEEWSHRAIAARRHAEQFGDWTTIASRVSDLL